MAKLIIDYTYKNKVVLQINENDIEDAISQNYNGNFNSI